MLNLNKPEPAPIRKDGETDVWPTVWADVMEIPTIYATRDLVVADMKGRNQFGWEQYGGPLTTNNGMWSLKDLYQEILDACVYTKKALLEGDLDAGGMQTLSEIYAGLLEQACAVRWLIYRQVGE